MDAFKAIMSYAQEYRHKIYLAVVLIFCSVLAGIIPYLITYDLIINFVEERSITLGYLAWMAVGVIVCLWLKSYLFAKGLDASHEAAYDTLMGMRMSFAEKLTRLPLGEIESSGTGSYKKKFVDDIEQVELLIAHMLPEGLPYVLTPLVVYGVLFFLDWRLALLSLASVLIGLLALAVMMKTGMKKLDHYYRAAANMNTTIVEYISGMEVIKIFNRTSSSFQSYVSSVEEYKKYTLNWYKSSWAYMAIYGSVLPMPIIFLLPFGTLFYLQGTLTLPTFIMGILLSLSIGLPLVKIVEFSPILPMLKYKIQQLEHAFAGQEITAQDKGIEPQRYDVEFQHVTFAYQQKDVLKNVSFCARENSVTAIVGESGSGKSTLAKLLVHFWDVREGAIRIGGVNIQDMSDEKLMNLISYVSQDTFLFNTSIMENIRIGRPDASDEEVIKAAKQAMCHEFISKMEQGYLTQVGDAGSKLSGGERQRITIARAILKDAPIIVLDEATAYVDAENEDKLHEALNQLAKGKTVLVIAHRLSTIVEADQIILMDQGELLMQGTHHELLERSRHYRALWEAHMQSSLLH
jgi:ATP-binding cassette subfamily B protein IrtA